MWMTVGMRGSVATVVGLVSACSVVFSAAISSSGNALTGLKVMSGATASSGFIERDRVPGRGREGEAKDVAGVTKTEQAMDAAGCLLTHDLPLTVPMVATARRRMAACTLL